MLNRHQLAADFACVSESTGADEFTVLQPIPSELLSLLRLYALLMYC